MRSDSLSPSRLLQAHELFGPQARPYNFDDHFDCWGLVQRVFDRVDDGSDVNHEAVDETTRLRAAVRPRPPAPSVMIAMITWRSPSRISAQSCA